MSKTKTKSKDQSDSESSSSSGESKGKKEKTEQSIWDSPHQQAQSSRRDEKRRERRRSNEDSDAGRHDEKRRNKQKSNDEERDAGRREEKRRDRRRSNDDGERNSTRHRSHRDDERRVDSNRRRKSPDRRGEDRRNRKESPPERRRYDDRRDRKDSRDDRRDNDRRKRSRSRERPANDRRGGGGGFKRRFENKEEDESNYEWGKRDVKKDPEETQVEKDKPNFGLSGKLTEETNTVHGIVIKYAEPPEAKIPKRRWRFYPFKGETTLPTLHIHRQSAFLIGRDRKVCDIAVDHPSCSKQHAALQYRLVPYERQDGSSGKRVRPYIIDLESSNGTFINNKKIEPKKYVELLEKDVIKFGFSSREYVLLHEASKDEAEDDDMADEITETATVPA